MQINIRPVKQYFLAFNCDYLLIHQFKHVLGAQKKRLIETVLLSTNNICFGLETKKIIFSYTLLSGGLDQDQLASDSHWFSSM